MDFFEHQELARRATRRLVLLMALAVLALIALTTALFAVVTVSFGSPDTVNLSQGNLWTTLTERVGWQTLAWISALIGLGVLGGSLFKWLQLRGGGRAVAESLGCSMKNGACSISSRKWPSPRACRFRRCTCWMNPASTPLPPVTGPTMRSSASPAAAWSSSTGTSCRG